MTLLDASLTQRLLAREKPLDQLDSTRPADISLSIIALSPMFDYRIEGAPMPELRITDLNRHLRFIPYTGLLLTCVDVGRKETAIGLEILGLNDMTVLDKEADTQLSEMPNDRRMAALRSSLLPKAVEELTQV